MATEAVMEAQMASQTSVPKYVPVKQFWAMMVYDFATSGVHL
jgi:hypothetical protein